MTPEQEFAFLELMKLRNEVIKASNKYIHPGRNISPVEYSQLTDWLDRVKYFVDVLQPEDLIDDNGEINTSIFPKAPSIICLNVLRMKFPFISEIRPSIY